MRIEKVDEGDIYVDWKKMRIVLLHNKHVCYIDINRDAIVYTTVERIRNDDWDQVCSKKEPIQPDPDYRADEIYFHDGDTPDEVAIEYAEKKRRGRPPGSKNKKG